MLEIEALIELLVEREIVTKEEFLAEFKKLDREMKERRKLLNLLNVGKMVER